MHICISRNEEGCHKDSSFTCSYGNNYSSTIVITGLSEYIRNNTTWEDKIEKSIYENVSRDGKSYGNDDNELIESGITTYIDNIEEKSRGYKRTYESSGESDKSISAAAVSGLDKTIGDSASHTLKDIASRIFAEQMTRIIVNAVSYCIVFIALFVILKLLTSVTGLISRLPVIHQADRLGGMAAGLIEGLIIVWLAFAVVTAGRKQVHGQRICLHRYMPTVFLSLYTTTT